MSYSSSFYLFYFIFHESSFFTFLRLFNLWQTDLYTRLFRQDGQDHVDMDLGRFTSLNLSVFKENNFYCHKLLKETNSKIKINRSNRKFPCPSSLVKCLEDFKKMISF